MRHLHYLHSHYRGIQCIPDSDEPVGRTVDHCNRRTEYELIRHVYQPDTCDECRIVSRHYERLCPKEGNK